jgi:hypothetical protein
MDYGTEQFDKVVRGGDEAKYIPMPLDVRPAPGCSLPTMVIFNRECDRIIWYKFQQETTTRRLEHTTHGRRFTKAIPQVPRRGP